MAPAARPSARAYLSWESSTACAQHHSTTAHPFGPLEAYIACRTLPCLMPGPSSLDAWRRAHAFAAWASPCKRAMRPAPCKPCPLQNCNGLTPETTPHRPRSPRADPQPVCNPCLHGTHITHQWRHAHNNAASVNAPQDQDLARTANMSRPSCRNLHSRPLNQTPGARPSVLVPHDHRHHITLHLPRRMACGRPMHARRMHAQRMTLCVPRLARVAHTEGLPSQRSGPLGTMYPASCSQVSERTRTLRIYH
jgi:hypothetical protein